MNKENISLDVGGSTNESNDSVDSSPANRRTFIKQGSAIVAAGTIGSNLVLPGSSHANPGFSKSVHPSGTDTIRVGLVGAGGRGTRAAIQAMNTTSGPVLLTAVGDVFENRLNDSLGSMEDIMQDEFKNKVFVDKEHQHVGFDAIDRVLESDVEMVILTTPPGFRPLHFEKAINAGKHVFMEKPVAVDAPGIRRVLATNEIAKDKGLMVGVGLQRRHEPAYVETIARLKDGEIGDINFAQAYWNGNTPWVRNRKEGETELEYQMKNWYFFNWICGDHIVEQHIHNIDVINWLKDGPPVKAQGQGGREIRKGKDHGQIFDHHMIEFTYADGSTMLSQCRHMSDCWNKVAEFAYGSKGSCDISRGIIKHGDEVIFKSEGSRGGHQQEHHDLFADLKNGRIPNEGEYGAMSTMTAIFGRMATYSGQELSWDQCFNSDLSHANVDDMTSFDDVAPIQPDADGKYPVPIPGKNLDMVY